MMWQLYFNRYKLFNYKCVHIVKPNVLRLNKDFYFLSNTKITNILNYKSHRNKHRMLCYARATLYRQSCVITPTFVYHD